MISVGDTLQRPSVVPTGEVKRHARGRRAHGVCLCRYQHQRCGARVLCMCHAFACQEFSIQLRARFRSELGQLNISNEYWSAGVGLLLISISPPRRRAGAGWHPPRHAHMPRYTRTL